MSCCCGCNPCLQYSCCGSQVTTTTIPVPPVVTCEEVAACVKADLQDLVAGGENAIDNFCEASVGCVNQALLNLPLGGSDLNNLHQAVFSVLRTISGFTNSQNIQLVSLGGVLQWVNLDTSISTTIPPELIYFGTKLDNGTPPDEGQIVAGFTQQGNGALDVSLNWGTPNSIPKYYWFAIQSGVISREKNTWYEGPINNGDMGTPSDLFGAPVEVMISGISYNVWITNFLTEFTGNSYVFSRV